MSELTKIDISILKDVYGDLLTERQKNVVELYCDCDCSLGEIAEQLGISRQGVRDAVVSAENAMLQYENALKIIEGRKQLSQSVYSALNLMEKGDLERAKKVLLSLCGE